MEHHLLAGAGHLTGQRNPVIDFEFAPLAADGLPQIDDVGLTVGGSMVKGFGIGLGPVEEQRPERKLHGWTPYCH